MFLQDVRGEVGNHDKRCEFEHMAKWQHLLTKQDVANLRRKVHDQTMIRHSDDATSVQMIVNELWNEAYDPVLIHKSQHVKTPDCASLPEDAIVLAIQTEWQKELFEKFSSTVLCIDSTHGTNTYQFKVITCIVPDNFGKGM